MTTPLSQRSFSKVALAISMLALLVAATSTAFAAGLAKNSVGTKQIKAQAVTAAKIKKGVVPPKTTTSSKELTISGTPTSLFSAGGLKFAATCNSASQDFVSVNITRSGGGDVSYSGVRSSDATNGDSTLPLLTDGQSSVEILNVAPSNTGFSMTNFTGQVTPDGKPPVLVQITVRVDDGDPVPCSVRVAATPTR